MHPALRLSNLDAFSPSVRETANSLLSGGEVYTIGSDGVGYILGGRLSELLAFLPVFYANLDPAGIPSSDTIAAMYAAGNHIDAVAAAAFSLDAISKLPIIPRDVYPELWVRAWFWIEWLHTYREHLHRLPDPKYLYGMFAELVIQCRAAGLEELVGATPGVRQVVVAAWNLCLDGPDPGANGLRSVSTFLKSDLMKLGSSSLQEYVEGAGGFDSLADIIIKHLGRALVGDQMPETCVTHCIAALVFISRGGQLSTASLFDAALRRHGLLRAIVACTCSLNSVAAGHSNRIFLLSICLNLLGTNLTQLPGRAWLSDAIQAGFLRALVLVASTHPTSTEIDEQVQLILTRVLPGYMVYHSILVHVRASLLEVEPLLKSDSFMASKSFGLWQRFYGVVRERLDFLDIFDATPSVLYKACDNMACSKIRPKSELQRCSTCRDLYYCSRQCQIIDWRAGHRLQCELFCGIRSLPEEQQCSKQDRSFMRALLHRDYLTHRPTIFAQEISHLKKTPHQLHQVRFDYTSGPLVINVDPWPTHDNLVQDCRFSADLIARYQNHGSRAAASAGRLVVHVIVIPNGLKYIPLESLPAAAGPRDFQRNMRSFKESG
ncbi:hypothetical protein DFH09DRAFT_1159403 [Mycena vulgaris]|nr:hypothetical protein DFH09DRAFT_1159403 [Mycena vulgaris]